MVAACVCDVLNVAGMHGTSEAHCFLLFIDKERTKKAVPSTSTCVAGLLKYNNCVKSADGNIGMFGLQGSVCLSLGSLLECLSFLGIPAGVSVFPWDPCLSVCLSLGSMMQCLSFLGIPAGLSFLGNPAGEVSTDTVVSLFTSLVSPVTSDSFKKEKIGR